MSNKIYKELFFGNTLAVGKSSYGELSNCFRQRYLPSLYDGTVSVYFDVVFSAGSSSACYVKLYNIDGNAVSGTEFSTTSTSQTFTRTGDISSSLSSGERYVVYGYKSGSWDGTMGNGRLVILQDGTITKTQTVFDLYINSSVSYTNSSSYVEPARTTYFKYNSDDWDGIDNVYFEAEISANSGTAYAMLYTSSGSAVSGSEVSTTSTSEVTVISSAVSLTDGYKYTVRIKNSGRCWLYGARLLIQQSSFSKSVSYMQLMSYDSTLGNETFWGGCWWDNDYWNVTSKEILFSATFKSGTSGTSNMLLKDDGSTLTTITTTSTTKDYHVSSDLSGSITDNSKLTSTSTYSTATGALYGHNVEIPFVIPAILTSNSSRSAKVTGKSTSNSNRSAKVTGGIVSNDARSAKIKGKAVGVSSRGARVTGGGQTVYSKGVEGTLPADDNPLTQYTEQEVTDVGADDNDFVSLDTVQEGYLIHLFSEKNDAETEVGFNVTIKVKSTIAPSTSTVYLQVYNRDTEEWENIDSDGSTGANTEFELSAYKGTDLSDYYDVDYVVSFRVYQSSTGVPI